MDQNTQTPPVAPTPAPQVPPPSGPADTNNDKTMAILAYIIFFIPLLAVKNRSAFLNFHVNQGLSLFIVSFAGSVVINALRLWTI